MFRETAARKVRMNHQCSGYKSVYIAQTGIVAHKNNFKFKRSFPCRNLLTGRSCEQSICTGSENLNISDTMTVKNQSDAKEAKGSNSPIHKESVINRRIAVSLTAVQRLPPVSI